MSDGGLTGAGSVTKVGNVELRLGKWQQVLADVGVVDAVITDPPYSIRTHAGQIHGRHESQDGSAVISYRGLGYDGWSAADVAAFVGRWAPCVRSWICCFTSSDLVASYEDAYQSAGLTTFAPIACVQRGMNVRLAGDGPSNWTTWLVVARTKAAHKWGTLPGAYVGSPCDPGKATQDRGERAVAGGKPVWLMTEIVRDYSRPGDLIVDPCAGGATTLRAAMLEGRRCIGSEMDPETFRKAGERLRGYGPSITKNGQLSLLVKESA